MNRVMASFTRSERSIITFVLLLVAGGFGFQQWQNRNQSAMVFSAGPAEAAGNLPKSAKAITNAGRIDVNMADSKTLEVLPGVGPAMAATLIRHRETNGPFQSMADLDKVPGIGPAMMSKLAPMVDFGPAATAAAPMLAQAPAMQNPDVSLATVPTAPMGIASIPPAQPMVAPASHTASQGQSTAAAVVNINTASASELETLNGIGPALAQRIILDRQRLGPFRSPENIIRVKGIGPKLLSKNRGRIQVK